MRGYLSALGLARHADTFEEEELTPELLRSMQPRVLHESLVELGLSTDEARRLSAALGLPPALPPAPTPAPAPAPTRAPAPLPAAAPPTSPQPPAATASSAFASRVRDLQQELFCEDVSAPPGAEAWADDELRDFFESGGECFPAAWPRTAPPPNRA